ncbi:hypothetical protein EV421DRAFT_1735137 [Armillaria borealis]|uniref:Uncharacterized protein n=1 Tax=Armillaria borealis TaxID=47425 RepID=A0AA39JMZ9_9AGAR|nr:hypothetical protein EV421DRAFT_1735137 [Armillaria borealis]
MTLADTRFEEAVRRRYFRTSIQTLNKAVKLFRSTSAAPDRSNIQLPTHLNELRNYSLYVLLIAVLFVSPRTWQKSGTVNALNANQSFLFLFPLYKFWIYDMVLLSEESINSLNAIPGAGEFLDPKLRTCVKTYLPLLLQPSSYNWGFGATDCCKILHVWTESTKVLVNVSIIVAMTLPFFLENNSFYR